MTSKTIHSKEQFEDWLSENDFLHDCRILRFDPYPPPEDHSPPSNAIIDLAYQIEGNYRANSKAVSKVFRLTASGIQEYSLPEGGSYFPENYSEGIGVFEKDDSIGLEIDVPALFTLICKRITIEELPNLVETVKPWLSERDIFAKIKGHGLPTPSQWVELFKKFNMNVGWHIYEEPIKPLANVPQFDYQGWYLQIRDKSVDLMHQGIFFFSCTSENYGFSIHIQNQGASQTLWQAAELILGYFSDAEIHCGNCEFTSSEWFQKLKNV